MNDKERLQLEEELLMSCSKVQAINKYIDELEENCKLRSELWCKSQNKWNSLKEWLEENKRYLIDAEEVLDKMQELERL